MCEARSDELKEFLEERRYCMLFISSLHFSVLLSLRSSPHLYPRNLSRPLNAVALRLGSRQSVHVDHARNRQYRKSQPHVVLLESVLGIVPVEDDGELLVLHVILVRVFLLYTRRKVRNQAVLR